MASVRTVTLRRSVLLCGCALGVLGWMAVGGVNAQSADPGKSAGPAAPMAAANQNSGLDMEATPAAPVAAASQNGGLDMGAGSSASAAGPASAAPSSASAPVSATVAAAPASGTLPAAPTASVAAGGVASSALAGAAAAASGPVTASAPGSVTLPRDNVQDGVHFALVNPGPVAAPAGSLTAPSGAPPAAPSGTPPTAPSGTSSATPSGTPTAPPLGTVVEPGSTQPPALATTASLASPPAPAEPINLDHPTVIDTDTLKAGDTTVSLYGIEGIQGEAAQGMQGFLAANAGRVTCQAQSAAGGFVCLLPDGTDVAEVALVNGAARVKDDAPPAYQEQEAAAQGARRGIWADLPPPPATVTHPTVQDTATLVSAGQTYKLDGIVGLAAPYAGQLQGYIQANGDALTCQPQGGEGSYICMMRDGTDIAKIALVNGAARVSPDATELLSRATGRRAEQSSRVLAKSAGGCVAGGVDRAGGAGVLCARLRRRRRRRHHLCRRHAGRGDRRRAGVPGVRRRCRVGLLRPFPSLAWSARPVPAASGALPSGWPRPARLWPRRGTAPRCRASGGGRPPRRRCAA